MQTQSQRRVVVTGIGVVSPIGCTNDAFWQSLQNGRSGISQLNPPTADAHSAGRGGEARDFRGHVDDFGDLETGFKRSLRKSLKVMNRETQLGVAAAQHALQDSRLAQAGYDAERISVCFGVGYVSMLPQDFLPGIEACGGEGAFDLDDWGEQGIPQVHPLWLLTCLPNMPACHIAILNDLRGANNSITQGDAATNLAVAEASRAITEGAADAVVVGGTGNNILPYSMMHTMLETEVAPGGADPTRILRPFDRRRSGSVPGEGAAAIILEEFTAATRRGATVYAEVIGAGSSCVVDETGNSRRDRSMMNAMQAALRAADVGPEGIGHVHAHGLSTRLSDIEEAVAIREVFGERTDTLPVVAGKSYFGDAGAGSGAMELAASLMALREGKVFRVLNYEDPDPACPIAPVSTPDAAAGTSFLSLNVVPEGQASCVIMRAAA
jgi:3-oxoacyl-[acyl-carrier-protein] synthase II